VSCEVRNGLFISQKKTFFISATVKFSNLTHSRNVMDNVSITAYSYEILTDVDLAIMVLWAVTARGNNGQ
jgi:hypothetical protein